MPDFNVNIKRLIKESSKGKTKTEIWAEITNNKNCETIKKRIFWEENGLFHDETPTLPVEVRNAVDNAWIEKSRKW